MTPLAEPKQSRLEGQRRDHATKLEAGTMPTGEAFGVQQLEAVESKATVACKFYYSAHAVLDEIIARDLG